MKLFLEGHGLIKEIEANTQEKYFLPLLDETLFADIQTLANILRKQGKNVLLGLSPKKLGKAIQSADKAGFSHVIIYAEDEKKAGNFVVKDLCSGEERREVL